MSRDFEHLTEIVTVQEACAILRMGRTTLYEMLATGRLRARKLGSRTVFRRSDIDEFLKNLPAMPVRAKSA
jgi:excisionase family DNA binding protein